jgi:hypothetical protein
VKTIQLGFEVGTGAPVSIPVQHTVITGQTQRAGKTTALEALISRSGLKAVAFVTKRGEGSFADAHTIPPYFREQADWKYVASILEATRGERMKFERSWIIKVSRGAHTLADVQRNVRKALLTAKGINEGVYTVLDAYLDDVVPLIAKVDWAKRVALAPGLNVVDMTFLNVEMQHLVIRSTMEWVLEHDEDTVVIVPEAWKFIPQGRGTPVKLAAESFIRQAAGLRNYLWLDSQDIAGVEKLILKSVPIWILGVQRESNEVKRTLAQIPAGTKKPKLEQIATLGLGEFYVCHDTQITKVYVQPAWMSPIDARNIALGKATAYGRTSSRRATSSPPEETVKESEARELREENKRLGKDLENTQRENDELSRRLDALERAPASRGKKPSLARAANDDARTPPHDVEVPLHASNGVLTDGLWNAIVERARNEEPRMLKLLTTRPMLEVVVTRKVVEASETTLRGRLAMLISEGFFDDAAAGNAAFNEMKRRAFKTAKPNVYRELDKLATEGFLVKESGGYKSVPGMTVNIVEG